jgi:hypothetical protein
VTSLVCGVGFALPFLFYSLFLSLLLLLLSGLVEEKGEFIIFTTMAALWLSSFYLELLLGFSSLFSTILTVRVHF